MSNQTLCSLIDVPAKAKAKQDARRAAKVPRACARMFIQAACELDAHAQRLARLEAAVFGRTQRRAR